MVQVLCCAQAADKVVAVTTIVAGTLDLSKVSHLVEDSGGLILGVASARQRCQTGEKQRAVDHLAGGWVCVC